MANELPFPVCIIKLCGIVITGPLLERALPAEWFCCCCGWITAASPEVFAAVCNMFNGCMKGVIIGVVLSWLKAGAQLFETIFASGFFFFGFGLFFHHFFRPCSGGSLFPPTKRKQL